MDKKMIAVIAGIAFFTGAVGGVVGSVLGSHGGGRKFSQSERSEGSQRYAERGGHLETRKGGNRLQEEANDTQKIESVLPTFNDGMNIVPASNTQQQ